MRHWVVGAGVALLLGLSAAQADPAWISFRAPDDTFTVDMPRAPAVSTKPITETATSETVPLTQYLIDDGNVALMVMVGDFSNSRSEMSIDGSVRGLQRNGRVLKSQTVIQLDGHEGRYTVLTDSHGFQLTDILFIVGRRLYQVITVVPGTATPAQAAEAGRFAQSFHFSNP